VGSSPQPVAVVDVEFEVTAGESFLTEHELELQLELIEAATAGTAGAAGVCGADAFFLTMSAKVPPVDDDEEQDPQADTGAEDLTEEAGAAALCLGWLLLSCPSEE